MARDHTTIHNQTWDYGFGVPVLDIESDYRTQAPGTFSRLVGIDGRYKGRLRRFPGWLKKWSIPVSIGGFSWVFGGTTPGLTMLESYAIQLGPGTGQVVRGIVFLVNDATGNDRIVTVYSVNGGATAAAILASFSGANGNLTAVDVAVDHQLLHIVGETGGPAPAKVEKLARFCGSGVGWRTVDWDSKPVRIATAPSARNSAKTEGTFLLKPSTLGLAYRFVYPDQGYVGPLTYPAVVYSGLPLTSTQGLFLTMEITAPLNGDVFTRCLVQVFRTICRGEGGVSNVEVGEGNIYLESEQEVPRKTGAMEGTSATFTTTTVTSAALAAVAVVGDVLYLRPRAASATNFDRTANLIVFRRQITNIVGNVITWNTAINIDSGTNLDFCVSRGGSEADSTGSFVFNINAGGVTPIRWGWNPGIPGRDSPLLTPVADCPTGMPDAALILQPQLDNEEFGVFPNGNPRAKFIELYDDIYVRITPTSTAETVQETDVIRWERVDKARKGLVPVLNRRRIPDLQSQVVDVVNAGPFLAVILNKGLIRVHRSGERLAIDPIHNRFGSIGRRGVVPVSSLLYLPSSSGILLADLNSGQIDVFGVTQHFFDESGRWANDLALIEGAFDAELGAVIFLNPVRAEMLCIWLNHSVLTHYIDVPFEHVVTSSDIQVGGVDRALFFVSPMGVATGGFYTIDSLRAGTYRTSAGNASGANLAWNGLAGVGTNSTTLVPPAGKAFSVDMVGHYVRFFDPITGAAKVRVKVTDLTAGNLTYAAAVPAPASGDRFAVAGIPFQATAWPLSGSPDQPVLDLFKIKKSTAMGAAIAEMSGDTVAADNPNLKMRYQMFGRGSSTAPLKEAEGTMDDDLNAPTFAAIAEVATVLVPGVEQWSSNLDFQALGMIVQGPIEGSRRD